MESSAIALAMSEAVVEEETKSLLAGQVGGNEAAGGAEATGVAGVAGVAVNWLNDESIDGLTQNEGTEKISTRYLVGVGGFEEASFFFCALLVPDCIEEPNEA
jgi:hypothetical protein